MRNSSCLSKLITISCLILMNSLYAQENVQKISLSTQDGIELGVQVYGYDYEEEVNGNYFMSTEGTKYGLSLTGTKTFDDIYVIGDIRYAEGDVKYKNYLGESGDNVSDWMYEARLLVGQEQLSSKAMYSFYTGLGYRYLFNDLRDLGSGGYRRESKYVYLPLGIIHRFRADQDSRICTSIEYDYFLHGSQTSYLSDVGPAYAAVFGDPVNKQDDGYGLRFNIAYAKEFFSIGVFYNYWNIDDSQTNYYLDPPFIYALKEPKNETHEIGIELKYHF